MSSEFSIVNLFSFIPENIWKLFLSGLLGLFVGLEREWNEKPAGVRTFSLISLLGTVFVLTEVNQLLFIGGIFIIILSSLLGIRGIYDPDTDGLSLTTSASMMVTYGVGLLVGHSLYIESVVITVFSSLVLMLKRELHTFASDLSKEELKSAIEFAIISFVLFPLLPNKPIDPWGIINPRLIWALVVGVSLIGFINYILIKKYGERGFLFSGFVGGLVSSTAVVAEISSRSTENTIGSNTAVSSILLANSAMAARNAVITIFFLPLIGLKISVPLFSVVITGIFSAYILSSNSSPVESNLDSPFSLKNALSFGWLFLLVVIVSAFAEQYFGSNGFLTTSFISGTISSGTSTSTAVLLFKSGSISTFTTSLAIIIGTIASILVKTVIILPFSREIIKKVFISNIILSAVGIITSGLFLFPDYIFNRKILFFLIKLF